MSGINIEVEQGSGNVYAGLGVPNAEKMLVRAGWLPISPKFSNIDI